MTHFENKTVGRKSLAVSGVFTFETKVDESRYWADC